jgi:hypothetical protein
MSRIMAIGYHGLGHIEVVSRLKSGRAFGPKECEDVPAVACFTARTGNWRIASVDTVSNPS